MALWIECNRLPKWHTKCVRMWIDCNEKDVCDCCFRYFAPKFILFEENCSTALHHCSLGATRESASHLARLNPGCAQCCGSPRAVSSWRRECVSRAAQRSLRERPRPRLCADGADGTHRRGAQHRRRGHGRRPRGMDDTTHRVDRTRLPRPFFSSFSLFFSRFLLFFSFSLPSFLISSHLFFLSFCFYFILFIYIWLIELFLWTSSSKYCSLHHKRNRYAIVRKGKRNTL